MHLRESPAEWHLVVFEGRPQVMIGAGAHSAGKWGQTGGDGQEEEWDPTLPSRGCSSPAGQHTACLAEQGHSGDGGTRKEQEGTKTEPIILSLGSLELTGLDTSLGNIVRYTSKQCFEQNVPSRQRVRLKPTASWPITLLTKSPESGTNDDPRILGNQQSS